MKYCCIFCICVFLICCTKNAGPTKTIIGSKDVINTSLQTEKMTTEPYNEYENRIVAYTTKQSGVSVNEIRYRDINFQSLPIEIKGIAFKDGSYGVYSDRGTFCMTNINDNNINVRNYPSQESSIIYKLHKNDIVQIIGFSGEKMNIDNFNGNWVNIIHQKNENEFINGWVTSKYVNIKDREYTPIRFVEFIPGGQPSREGDLFIRLSYTIEGNEVFFSTWSKYWNNYYIIVWQPFDNGFHYSNRPGVYIFDVETLELVHKTYLGTFTPSANAWTVFTEDHKFLMQDSGTSPGVRGIKAWRLSNFELIYSGGYYSRGRSAPPIIGNNMIEVVYLHDDWRIEHGYLTDEEIILYGRKFKEENTVPRELIEQIQHSTFEIELLVKCSFNLDTSERIILGGEYIISQ